MGLGHISDVIGTVVGPRVIILNNHLVCQQSQSQLHLANAGIISEYCLLVS